MRAIVFGLLLTCGLLAGCGQKGPLYLPEDATVAGSNEQPQEVSDPESRD